MPGTIIFPASLHSGSTRASRATHETLKSLEAESGTQLELTPSNFRAQMAERISPIYVQDWWIGERNTCARRPHTSRRLRMIEYVRRIYAYLETLRFTDFDRFRESHIRAPSPWTVESVLSERPQSSRHGILKNDVALRIRNCLKGAEVGEFGGDHRALRIIDILKIVAEVVALIGPGLPVNPDLIKGKGPT